MTAFSVVITTRISSCLDRDVFCTEIANRSKEPSILRSYFDLNFLCGSLNNRFPLTTVILCQMLRPRQQTFSMLNTLLSVIGYHIIETTTLHVIIDLLTSADTADHCTFIIFHTADLHLKQLIVVFIWKD